LHRQGHYEAITFSLGRQIDEPSLASHPRTGEYVASLSLEIELTLDMRPQADQPLGDHTNPAATKTEKADNLSSVNAYVHIG
jgi:hypothetical protein